MKKSRTIIFLGSLMVFCAPLLFGQTGSAHSDKLSGTQVEFFNAVSDELICQCGCNLVLSGCGHVNCPSAVPMRKKIEEMILAQKSKEQILNYFMTEYSFEGKPPKGRAILSQPDTKGFDLMAWIMPFILFGVFSVVVLVIVRRATHARVGPPSESGNAGAVSGFEKRIEEELKKLD